MAFTLRKRRARRRNGERGVELIEFALTFPLLLLVVLGIVDFAFVFHHNQVLANAAREGARVASLPAYTTTDVETRINEYLQAGGLPATPTITVTTTTIPYGTGTWPATTVNVAYTHSYMFVGGFVGWFGGTFSPDVTIGAQATMRHELGS